VRFGSVLGLLAAPALLFGARAATAEARPRAVLLQARTGSAFSTEIAARLRGELEASNLELRVLAAPENLTAKEAVQTEGSDFQPEIVLFVLEQREGAQRTEEIWVSDRLATRLFVQRLDADPADPLRSARWVAVQAAELVRARIADSRISRKSIASRAKPPAPPPPLVKRSQHESPELGAGLGIGLLHGFRGLADTWVPMARVSVSLFDSALGAVPLCLDARVSVGVGVERGLVYGDRSASLRQSFGMADLLVRFAPNAAVQPLLSIGGGAYALDVAGLSSAPYHNHSTRTWSGLNSVGTGLGFVPFTGASLVLDATLMDVWSETLVRFGTHDVVQVGAPIALVSMTASAVF